MIQAVAEAFMVAMTFLSGHVSTQLTALFIIFGAGVIYLTGLFASEWGKAALGVLCGAMVLMAWRLGSPLALVSGVLFAVAIVWAPAVWAQILIVTFWATWLCEPSKLRLFIKRAR